MCSCYWDRLRPTKQGKRSDCSRELKLALIRHHYREMQQYASVVCSASRSGLKRCVRLRICTMCLGSQMIRPSLHLTLRTRFVCFHCLPGKVALTQTSCFDHSVSGTCAVVQLRNQAQAVAFLTSVTAGSNRTSSGEGRVIGKDSH